MLSNSYSSPWLGHTLELGSQGWRRAARAVPAVSGRARAGVMLSRAWGLCRNVCVCRDSTDSQPLCRDPPPAPPALPAGFASCAGISLFSPKSCHHVAKDSQYLVCSNSARDPEPDPDLPVHVCTAKLLLLWRETALHRGGVWCFVKVLLGWLSTENSRDKSLYISCKQKLF